jgi:hypothetical protein
MKEVREIKKAQTKVKKLDNEIADIHGFMAEYQRTYNAKKKERISLITKIEEMKKGELKVSEHAVLRYIERVIGINLEEVEKNILKCIPESQEILGNGTYPCGEYKVVVKENTVVTIINE